MDNFRDDLIKDMMPTLSELSLNGVYIADTIGLIYVNKGFANMFGYAREDILSRKITMRELIIPEHYPTVLDITDKIFRDDMVENNVELTGIRRDGQIIFLSMIILSDVYRNQKIIVGSVIDNTEKVKIEKQVYYAAYYDYVTDLPNRRMFIEQLDKLLTREVAAEQKTAMVLINIKRFRLINNSLGHQIGELLIQQLVKRLKSCIIEGQTLYRIAGDKFCLVSFKVEDRRHIINFTEHIFQEIKEDYVIEGYRLNIELSIGISMSPQDGNTVDSLFRAAETALYFSETEVRDKAREYSSGLSVKTFRLFSLVNDLPKALNDNQLFLEYMPRLETETKKIVGMEALLRWRHPDWGVVSPIEFIPIAEELGLIIPIGEWVLREACRQNQVWLSKGYAPITVSVNFSASQLLQDNILQTIDQVLADTRLPPELLEIELTESIFISNEGVVVALLDEFKKRKIKVSLDDFGTGYSSLYSLKHLKVDALKIDRSFIQDMFTDSVNQSIVQNIMSLAKELGMRAVAEGVETLEQYTLMKQLHCDEIQGYYFSRPLAADLFQPLLETQHIIPQQPMVTKRPEPIVDQREDFRMELLYPLISEMTIIMFKGEELNLETTEVFVKNLCNNGLRFIMGVKLPINDEIVLQFTLNILEQSYTFRGNIVWYKEVSRGEVYEYGLHFI